jgi:hypothetical protein
MSDDVVAASIEVILQADAGLRRLRERYLSDAEFCAENPDVAVDYNSPVWLAERARRRAQVRRALRDPLSPESLRRAEFRRRLRYALSQPGPITITMRDLQSGEVVCQHQVESNPLPPEAYAELN